MSPLAGRGLAHRHVRLSRHDVSGPGGKPLALGAPKKKLRLRAE